MKNLLLYYKINGIYNDNNTDISNLRKMKFSLFDENDLSEIINTLSFNRHADAIQLQFLLEANLNIHQFKLIFNFLIQNYCEKDIKWFIDIATNNDFILNNEEIMFFISENGFGYLVIQKIKNLELLQNIINNTIKKHVFEK